jgi:predicted GNAT family N-acyltransferase
VRTPLNCRIDLLDWSAAVTRAWPLRLAVFVREQQVPEELERDEWDALSLHALAIDAGGRAVGTGRLLPDGHIGRMAVAPEARGRGIGSALLRALIDEAARRGHAEAVLNAQVTAMPFYARHGFVARGEPFMEAGIEHRTMARSLAAIAPH